MHAKLIMFAGNKNIHMPDECIFKNGKTEFFRLPALVSFFKGNAPYHRPREGQFR